MYTIPRQNQSHYRIRSIESITQTTVLVALAVPPLEIARAKVAMFAMRSAMFRTKPDSSTTCLELPCWFVAVVEPYLVTRKIGQAQHGYIWLRRQLQRMLHRLARVGADDLVGL